MLLPNGWSKVEGRLMREWTFPDFLQAKAFVDAVSELCEVQQHHAEFHFGWGYAIIESYTHDRQCITQLDIDLATAINQLEVGA